MREAGLAQAADASGLERTAHRLHLFPRAGEALGNGFEHSRRNGSGFFRTYGQFFKTEHRKAVQRLGFPRQRVGIKQLAARLNYPIFEVTGRGRLEFADLCGHISLHEGSMRYEYGPLSLAMRYGGLFLINEVDLLSPEVAVGLNGVLEGAPLCLPENGGEVIHPHEMFRIACTGNTNGGGDDTGLYQGTGRMNLAWLDRFMLCEVNYPDAVVEKDLLVKLHPVLPEHIAVKMVDFANEIRKQFIGASDAYTDTIEVTLSTRTLLRWADLTLRFQPLAHQGIQPLSYALDRALGFRASRPTRAMLHELLQRMFPMDCHLGE